ncbi:unnamed protein product, partial [Brassica napus]
CHHAGGQIVSSLPMLSARKIWPQKNRATLRADFVMGFLLFKITHKGSRDQEIKGSGEISAIQLSSEHNANNEDVCFELKDLHPDDPQIVVFKHGVWRVKGIIQVVYHSLQHLYSTVIEE